MKKSPYEFRKVGGVWQRRLIKPGERWHTLSFETSVTHHRNGRNQTELAHKKWVWK
jgi:hypothetical protein